MRSIDTSAPLHSVVEDSMRFGFGDDDDYLIYTAISSCLELVQMQFV